MVFPENCAEEACPAETPEDKGGEVSRLRSLSISKSMTVTFLDDNTLLLGSDSAIRTALNVREGSSFNVDTNQEMTKMIKSVQKAPVWSVLDQRGSQNMLVLALGNSRELPGYEKVKKQVLGLRVLGSRYDEF